jgi:hypothetical protein
VNARGEIVRGSIDAHGEVGAVEVVGSVFSLPVVSERVDRRGTILRTVRDDTGALIRYAIARGGDVEAQVIEAAARGR